MRIISLLPSATEIICALGLEDSLVGVSHECDYPESVKTLPKVTQTFISKNATSGEIDSQVRSQLSSQDALYSLNTELVESLQPDLLVTQALCDVCAVSEAEVSNAAATLRSAPLVINLEPMSLDDVFATLHRVGDVTDRADEARRVVTNLEKRVAAVGTLSASIDKAAPRVVFLEWIDPPFNAGHWNSTLIELAGGHDCLGNKNSPSETTPWAKVLAAQPEFMLLACCGFPVERALQDVPLLQQQPGWSELPCIKNGRVFVTDGNAYFSRPGPRLVDSLEILAHALHPDIHPLPVGLPAAVPVVGEATGKVS